jgi:hypothetical protein
MGILDIFGVGGITNVIDDILKMFPNAEQRAAAENKLTDLVGQVAAAQSATNTAEAATGNIFLAGWRPFIGWICGFGFLYSVVQPIVHFPPIDTANLQAVLYGMLGLGAMRTAEKITGVATTAIKKLIK